MSSIEATVSSNLETVNTDDMFFSVEDDVFFDIDGVRYVAWPISQIPPFRGTEEGALIIESLNEGFVTVLPCDQECTVGAEYLKHEIDTWAKTDDVFNKVFLEQIIFASTRGSSLEILPDARDLLKSYGAKAIGCQKASQALPGGPYILAADRLLQIRRLYEDSHCTFLSTFKRNGSSSHPEFGILNDGKHGWDQCSAAVPSRLAATPSPERPFDGCRIALKDAFNLKGVRTSLCNRAYLDLYPPATSTAPCLQGLVSGGGEILGKTKLSMLLSREEPSESVDFPTAWNPRGDGYQSPGGSSSGSAVAVGAYNWVDIGIGTDTNGSIRRPAQCNGCFGLRPSQGALNSEGIFSVFKVILTSHMGFDVPGIFARDLKRLTNFASSWYANTYSQYPSDLPVAILFPSDFYPPAETQQHRVVKKLVDDLENYLDVKANRMSIVNAWKKNPPPEAKGHGLHEYLENVGANTFLYANYHSAEDFRRDYHAATGVPPFVSQFVRWRWSVGEKISDADHDEAMDRIKVYAEWFLSVMMRVKEYNTLVVMQSEDVKPNYRDDPPPEYYIQPAWHQWWISSVLGAPEIVLPSGQIPYTSRITQQTEYLPVTTSILSQPGSDSYLLGLAESLFEWSGRPCAVATGKEMFSRDSIYSEKLQG